MPSKTYRIVSKKKRLTRSNSITLMLFGIASQGRKGLAQFGAAVSGKEPSRPTVVYKWEKMIKLDKHPPPYAFTGRKKGAW